MRRFWPNRFQTRKLLGSLVFLSAVSGPAWSQEEAVLDDPLVGGGEAAATNGATGDGSAEMNGDLGGEELSEGQRALQEKMAQAESLMKEKKWTEAIQVYNEVLAMNSNANAIALVGQAECLYNLNSVEQAVTAVSRALIQPGATMFPGLQERAVLLRGRIYLDMGRYREAMEDLGAALQANPGNPEANYLSGKASLRMIATANTGGLDQGAQATLLQGVAMLQRAIELKPNFGEAYLERGRILFRLGEMDFAIQDHEQATRILGPSSDAAADLGVALSRRAREKATGPSPDGEAIVEDLRNALRNLDGYLKTARLGMKTPPWQTQDPIRVEPDSVALTRVETAIALGDELEGNERTEQYQSALADSDKMLALELSGIDKARAHYTRGVALRMMDQLLPAVDAFTEAIQAWPSVYGAYSEAHLRRGICYYHLGEYGEALQDFDAAAAMASNPYAYEPRAMLWAGMTQVRQGDLDAAIRSYTRAVSTAPTFVPSLVNRGLAYLHQGRYQAAVEDFDSVLRLDPHHADALAYRKLASDRLASQP